MKQVFRVVLIAAFVALGIQSRAEAVTTLQVDICHGAICTTFGPNVGTNFSTSGPVTIGDFTVDGSVSSLENILLSNAATTTIAVQRLTTTFAAQGNDLTIWLNATGYNMPVGPDYVFRTTLSATSSGDVGVPAAANVAFQGWFSDANVVGFPPAGSVSPGSNGCALGPGTDNCTAAIGLLGVSGTPLFGMTTRTTFTVANASATNTYTSNGQANLINAEVPEPASMLLFGTGLVGLARAARRRRNQTI